MESQTRNENVETNANRETTRGYSIGNLPNHSHGILVIFILRSVAVILTFVSAILLGTAKESIILSNSSMRSGIIKSTQFAAYAYFIIANVAVLLYSLASIVLSFANRGVLGRIVMPLSIGDLIMVVLLFSCNGAAASVSIISDNGQPNIGWNHICGVLTKFCGSIQASIVLSMFAGVIYFALVAHALVGNQKQLLTSV